MTPLERRQQIINNIAGQFTTSSVRVVETPDNPIIGQVEHTKNQIVKSFTEGIDLEKAIKGEGSKGGKIIGHTKSGKPIYEKKSGNVDDFNKKHKGFLAADHKDAMTHHAKHMSDLKDKNAKGYGVGGFENFEEKSAAEKEYKKHDFGYTLHRNAAKDLEEKEQEKKSEEGKPAHEKLNNSARALVFHAGYRTGKDKKEFLSDDNLKDDYSKEDIEAARKFHSEHHVDVHVSDPDEDDGDIERKQTNFENRKSKSGHETYRHDDGDWKGVVAYKAKELKKSVEDEIEKAFSDLLEGGDFNKSFNNELGDDKRDEIRKGEIMDKLGMGYGGNSKPIEFVKTGKQLKEMMPVVIANLNAKKTAIETLMNGYKEAAGVEPEESYPSYSLKKEVCKRYPWKAIETYDEINRQYLDRTDEQKAMSNYNDCCYVLSSIVEDIAACNVIIANVEDKKSYTLSVSQLIALSAQ